VTDLEQRPGVVVSGAEPHAAVVEVLTPRDVPLGGPRAMTVRRTLPQRRRSLIGAWCFVDHYGPDDVAASGGMQVPGHPHTGLQTVTWLFEGEVEHRDTLGTALVIRPGEVNLMTSGIGIAHSEYSTPSTTRLHGAQLWLALPDEHRAGARAFQHYAAPQFDRDGARLRVFIGRLAGESSPIETFTPTLGAEIVLEPSAELQLEVDPGFEHGVLVDTGSVSVQAGDSHTGDSEAGPVAASGASGELLFVGSGRERLSLRAGDEGARVLLIGGEPLGERIVMWWNFIGRSHDDIVEHRRAWQARVEEFDRDRVPTGALTDAPTASDGADVETFGEFPADWQRVLPAPELPTVRLTPRR
jgi:redox-sensitive bicupin YhaK (pirin superfamily)